MHVGNCKNITTSIRREVYVGERVPGCGNTMCSYVYITGVYLAVFYVSVLAPGHIAISTSMESNTVISLLLMPSALAGPNGLPEDMLREAILTLETKVFKLPALGHLQPGKDISVCVAMAMAVCSCWSAVNTG